MHHARGAFAALALLCLPSCTLLGLGTGATIDAITAPHYSDVTSWPLKKDERLRVETHGGNRIQGRYAGFRAPSASDLETRLLVREENGRILDLPYSDVRRIGVERPGKGWLYGTLVGLAIDVAVVVGLAAAQPSIGGWGENSNFEFK